jgi:hypothetical protein
MRDPPKFKQEDDMDIVFAGICCWVDAVPPKQGKTVIIRNALRGGTHAGDTIPSHWAFIHAKRDDVDTANWPISLAGDDNVFLYLTGDYLTIDPQPTGGITDISLLPHVLGDDAKEPICPAADRIRTGFCQQPQTSRVLALVDLPPDAPVTCEANEHKAIYATLHIPQAPVTITATPFADSPGLPRSLIITNPNAEVFIANVSFGDYLIGAGAPDDNHKYLVCDIFKSATQTQLALPANPDVPTTTFAAVLSLSEVHANELDHVSLGTLKRAAGREMRDFLSTLAAGCSDSQWP